MREREGEFASEQYGLVFHTNFCFKYGLVFSFHVGDVKISLFHANNNLTDAHHKTMVKKRYRQIHIHAGIITSVTSKIPLSSLFDSLYGKFITKKKES